MRTVSLTYLLINQCFIIGKVLSTIIFFKVPVQYSKIPVEATSPEMLGTLHFGKLSQHGLTYHVETILIELNTALILRFY